MDLLHTIKILDILYSFHITLSLNTVWAPNNNFFTLFSIFSLLKGLHRTYALLYIAFSTLFLSVPSSLFLYCTLQDLANPFDLVMCLLHLSLYFVCLIFFPLHRLLDDLCKGCLNVYQSISCFLFIL